ncbi:MAG: hypothetical protein HYX69_05920 [Planctomycetia bacterium]|nr:hypothetical protein [Planctomycetia bacterium]
MTVTSTPVQGGTALRIVGDEVTNLINIYDQGNGYVDVRDGSGKLLGSADSVKEIDLDSGAGSDVIRYTLLNVLLNSQDIFFQLGSGNDWATFDMSKGVGRANLQIQVQGQDGDDMISATLGAISRSRVNVFFRGDNGNDHIYVGDPNAEIWAGSSLLVDLDGGAGNDDLRTAYTGHLFGTLNVAVRGGAGMDDINVNTKSDEDSNGRLYVLAAGGAGTDKVTLYANDYSGDGGPSNLADMSIVIFDPTSEDQTTKRTPNVAMILFYVPLSNVMSAGTTTRPGG